MCLERLPAILKERRREPKQACPAWVEAGAELIQVLLHSPPRQSELLATQLSDALELALSPSVASAATARQLVQALRLDTKGALDALPYSGCVVWLQLLGAGPDGVSFCEKDRGIVKRAVITQQRMEMVPPSFGLAASTSAKVVLVATLSSGLG